MVFCGEITFINVPLFFLPLSNSLNPQESSRLGAILRFFFKSVSGDITPLMLFFSAAATRHPIVVGVHIGNAVPVELGRAIGVSILQHLENMGVE